MAQPKRISQETFDAVVRENIDEFEMDLDEAVADARQQFESQGVDLSNLITTFVREPGTEGSAGLKHSNPVKGGSILRTTPHVVTPFGLDIYTWQPGGNPAGYQLLSLTSCKKICDHTLTTSLISGPILVAWKPRGRTFCWETCVLA
jgi:hypothetical protein